MSAGLPTGRARPGTLTRTFGSVRPASTSRRTCAAGAACSAPSLPSRQGSVVGPDVDWLLCLPMTASGFDQAQVHMDQLYGKVCALPTRPAGTAADAARIGSSSAPATVSPTCWLWITTASSRARCSKTARGAPAQASSTARPTARTQMPRPSGSRIKAWSRRCQHAIDPPGSQQMRFARRPWGGRCRHCCTSRSRIVSR